MVLPAQRPRMPTVPPAIGAPAESPPDAQAIAEQLLTGHFTDRPAPRAWGWATPGGGRSANVEGGVVYQATSAQVCGLYPFALSSGAATPGVPIGRHMLTAEPVGLDPAEWLREGLVSNTGVWVQGQPGIGKSTIVKRMLTGLICFGAAAVIPGDVKGEYSDLVDALGGRVWRIGRGRHTLNPLDAGPLRAAAARTCGADRDRLLETIRARQLSLLEALVVIVRRGQITVTERLILGEAALGQRRHVVRVQDELWRALRVAPGLVEMSDRVTRLNRHRGEISFQVTHSLDDLEALPTEVDRAKARGMASRAGIMVLGGMADKELDGIRRITPMTSQEIAMVRSWAALPTWIAGSAHPGRGKYLLKSGERMGLPVALNLVAAERELYDIDRAWRRAP